MDDRAIRELLRRDLQQEQARALEIPGRRAPRLIGLVLASLGALLGLMLLGAAVWLHYNLDPIIGIPFVFGAGILGLMVGVPSVFFLVTAK